MSTFLSDVRARSAQSSSFLAKCALAAVFAFVLMGPWAQHASATPNYPPPSVCSVSALSNGTAVVVDGTGFASNSSVVLSSGGSAQTVAANAAGSFSRSLTASAGATIVATGEGCVANDVVQRALPAAVVAPVSTSSGLAFTGVQVTGLLVIGVAFIVVGVFAVRGARKSSNA